MSPVARLPTLFQSLSARLLVLTVAFVMLSEVLIFTPSVARFRVEWLKGRVQAAQIAALSLMATRATKVDSGLERALLARVGAYAVALRSPQESTLLLSGALPPIPDRTVRLGRGNWASLIADALATLAERRSHVLRLVAPMDGAPDSRIELILDDGRLRHDMIGFAQRVFSLSLMISLLAAGLVYVSLQWLMVRPMRHLTQSLVAFRADPEGPPSKILAGAPHGRGDERGRGDEIGIMRRELSVMQTELRAALGQKSRLAMVGGAVTKINHDLRAILASALLMSDRLTVSDDPQIRRCATTVIDAIERAVNLCTQTMKFAREGAPALKMTRFPLAGLVAETGEVLGLTDADSFDSLVWDSRVPEGLDITADREQMFRVLVNLARNAGEAGATRLTLTAEAAPDQVSIHLADDGPGLPPAARERLFQPFAGSARVGGTGLGLVIARDLMRAHGGDIVLVETGAAGTHFRLDLPWLSEIP